MKKADKKEFKVKKLVLSKETLRILSGENLQKVVGGAPPQSADTDCNITSCITNPTTSDAC